jgi:hypothetical protein
MRDKNFKIMMTARELDQVRDMAHEQRVTAADLGRFLIIGPNACQRLPSAAALREIAMVLARISDNINRCQKAIHTAKLAGTLDTEQFDYMSRAIALGHKDWTEPLAELRRQMDFLRPRPAFQPGTLPTKSDVETAPAVVPAEPNQTEGQGGSTHETDQEI